MAIVTTCSDFGAQENKIYHFSHLFPIYLPWDWMPWSWFFCKLNFKSSFSLSSFTSIKRLFSSSSLSAIEWYHLHIWSCWYFSWQSWFQLVLHPAFCMMHSAYKLNKQGNNIQPWSTPFNIFNWSIVPCPVLTVASWPTYRFLRRQVKWSDVPIFLKIFHSLFWSTAS